MHSYFNSALKFLVVNKRCLPGILKKGLELYLMIGPNSVLGTFRWDDGRSTGHDNMCRLFFFTLGPS